MGTDANRHVRAWRSYWSSVFHHREDQVFLVLTLLIGALVGLVVVAFILMTERLGSRLYPMGGARSRWVLMPVTGSLAMGYLLFKYFPKARGSGVPQTKAALYAHEGYVRAAAIPLPFASDGPVLYHGLCREIVFALRFVRPRFH